MNDLDEYVYETKVSQYDFIECAAQTSTGFLYKCLSKSSGEIVVIRVITVLELDELEETLKEVREAVVGLTEQHAAVHDCFIYSGNLYLVLEHFENGSLMDLIGRKKTLEEFEVAAIAKHLVQYMDHFHRLGTIINDIKPSHIFISAQGKIKMFPFAMSQLFQKRATKSKSVFKGAPFYLAPEIIQGSRPSKGSDVWGLGISLSELATGQLPYRNFQKTKVLFEILNSPPPSLGSQFSSKIRDFVSLCLNKDHAKRPNTQVLLEHPFLRDAPPQNAVAEIFFKTAGISGSFSDQHSDLNADSSAKASATGEQARPQGKATPHDIREILAAPLDPNKGSIVSNHYFLSRTYNQAGEHEAEDPTEPRARLPDNDPTSTVLLKLKRAASKVDKLRPGLTALIFREIIEAYDAAAAQKLKP